MVFLMSSFISINPVVKAAEVPFPDMAQSWFHYRDSVSFLKERKAITGYPDGTFKPKNTVNRAEFLKLIFAARGSAEPVAADCFSDVKKDAWYAPYVCAAERRKIVSGYPDGSFGPEQKVKIAEAVKMVVLAYGNEVHEGTGERWFEAYARVLDRTDVFPRHSYLPSDELTRERAADLIVRVLRFEEERIVPNLSAGCGKASVKTPTSVTVNGLERTFILSVPKNYVNHDPTPLIVAFHGRTNSNEQVKQYYDLDKEAKNYFVVYPAAIQNENGSYSWSSPGDKSNSLRDIAFFDAIVEEMANDYCIDLDRIYTFGHSLGAWFANSVACIRGDVVRASGTVGGDSVITKCAGPTAAFIAHNPKDNLASFSSTERAYQHRVEQNQCEAGTKAAEPQTLKCISHNGCDGRNDVVWCPHEIDNDWKGNFYPHTWPDFATEGIVSFFEGLR
jgi:polyhydroxybutyrate depolymerase